MSTDFDHPSYTDGTNDPQKAVEAALAADREAALRDVFAAAAMASMVQRLDDNALRDLMRMQTGFSDHWSMFRAAYFCADGMLLARKK
jgi:hypothetical protein